VASTAALALSMVAVEVVVFTAVEAVAFMEAVAATVVDIADRP
jgi:hypothetical protein